MNILDAARKARRPWESPESISLVGERRNGTLSITEVVTVDSPEQVQKCLTCVKPVCNNCAAPCLSGRKSRAVEGQEKMEGF